MSKCKLARVRTEDNNEKSSKTGREDSGTRESRSNSIRALPKQFPPSGAFRFAYEKWTHSVTPTANQNV